MLFRSREIINQKIHEWKKIFLQGHDEEENVIGKITFFSYTYFRDKISSYARDLKGKSRDKVHDRPVIHAYQTTAHTALRQRPQRQKFRNPHPRQRPRCVLPFKAELPPCTEQAKNPQPADGGCGRDLLVGTTTPKATGDNSA